MIEKNSGSNSSPLFFRFYYYFVGSNLGQLTVRKMLSFNQQGVGTPLWTFPGADSTFSSQRKQSREDPLEDPNIPGKTDVFCLFCLFQHDRCLNASQPLTSAPAPCPWAPLRGSVFDV